MFERIYNHVEEMNVKLEAITREVKEILKLLFVEIEIKNAILN